MGFSTSRLFAIGALLVLGGTPTACEGGSDVTAESATSPTSGKQDEPGTPEMATDTSDEGSSEDSGEDPSGGDESEAWTRLGLEGFRIRGLYLTSERIFALTTRGLLDETGVFRSRSAGAGFDKLDVYEEGKAPAGFIELPDGRLLVGGWEFDQPLLASADGGDTWARFASEFGEDGFPEAAYSFAMTDSGSLLGTGVAVVAELAPGTQAWQPLWGSFLGIGNRIEVVRIDPHTGEFWAGGQNAVERSLLLHFAPDGTLLQELQNTLPEPDMPSTVDDIQFDPERRGRIFVGMEGGLMRSDDGGQTWSLVIDHLADFRFIKTIRFDPDDPNIMYAGSWLKTLDHEPQPFFLYRSFDRGESWHVLEGPDIELGGIQSAEMTREHDRSILYLGTYNGGLWRVDTSQLPPG